MRYDSYKDSGVEWIGEIPSHWKISKFKYDSLTPVQYGINISGDKYVEEGIRFVRITDIRETGDLNPIDGKYLIPDDVPNEFLLRKFDVLFCRSGHTVGKTYLHISDGLFTSGGYLVRFNFKNYSESKFIFYVSKTDFYWDWIKLNTVVSTIENVNGDKYQNFLYPKPPISEQNQIVSYLDRKTAQIDSLIDKTKRKIELLKEKRTALINEVVTKGLDPNVPMKDSGVEWIGEIPRHWEITSLKYQVNENELSLGNNTDPNYELDYIEISDVNSEGAITNTTHYHFKDSPSRCRRIVRKGDVILSTVRTYLRSIGIIEGEVSDLICSTGFSVLSPNKNLIPKFLFYMVRTEWFISDVIAKSEGVSYPSIQSEKLKNLRTLVVPLHEQHQIVSYLDEHTQLIDKTISVEERRIDYLKEYRQSIISEVVTGKRKVVKDEQ